MDSNASVKQRFGEWLKAKREETRYSQGGAAQRAGIDRQQWYRIENGLSGTKRDTVIAIAKSLNLPVEETLEMAGFKAEPGSEDPGYSFDLDPTVRIKMLERPGTDEELREFEEEMRLAYELIVARMNARRSNDKRL